MYDLTDFLSSKNSVIAPCVIAAILEIVFVTLKLSHVITWSWWWVFSPALILAAIIGVLIFLVYLIMRHAE